MSNQPKAVNRLYIAEQDHVRELNTLHAATVALLNTIELPSLVEQVLTVAMRAVPAAEKGLLLLADPQTGEMQIRAARGYADAALQPGSAFHVSGYMSKVVRERATLLVGDDRGNGSPGLRGGIPEMQQLRSSIIGPLLLEESVLGALSLDSTQPNAFSEADVRLLAAFAATASVAIRNAQLYSEMQRQAITDHLTGLFNRRGFFELGQRELERARRFHHALGCILFDLDRFKQINDTYGHNIGDEVIRAVAARCRKNLRVVDILARYGGEEFSILLPETDMTMLYQVAERLRLEIQEQPIETERGLIPITISVGVTMATDDTPDLADLLNRADSAMFAAKQMGGNYLVVR